MKKVIGFVMALVMAAALTACGSPGTDEKKADDLQPDTMMEDAAAEPHSMAPGDDAAADDGGDMDGFSAFVERAEEMGEYLNEAVDKAAMDGLGFNIAVLTPLGSQMQGVYVNYQQYGDNWDDTVESQEWGVITDTSIHKQNGIYTYANVAYDDENPDEMLVETIITYDKDNRMVHRYTNTTEPLMQSHDQYYLDESGRLFYVLTELAGNTLYINMVYYDGARLDVAQKSIDGKTELELVYDFTQQTPQSFEDMRVVDDLDLYLTYDGQTCTVEGFND